MNTGAEAVETAIKVARKWGYERQGRRRRPREDRRGGGNFHGRTTTIVWFSDDPAARERLRAVHARLRDRAVRRRGRAGAPRSTTTTWSVLVEPIQGEAGVRDPARRLPARGARAVHRARRAVHRRRDPVRARPHRAHVRLRPRGRRAGHLRAGQGARRWHRAAVARSSPTTTCSACCARASTARPSAATRWPARSAREVRGAAGDAASTRSEPRRWARGCTTGCARAARPGVPRAARPRPVGRRRHRAGADASRRAGTASGWPSAGCLPRTPTAPRSGWPRRWSSRRPRSTASSTR